MVFKLIRVIDLKKNTRVVISKGEKKERKKNFLGLSSSRRKFTKMFRGGFRDGRKTFGIFCLLLVEFSKFYITSADQQVLLSP